MFSDYRRLPPNRYTDEDLGDLLLQVLETGRHERKSVLPSALRGVCRIEEKGGRYQIQISLQGSCSGSYSFAHTTNGGAWVAAAVGWYPTREAAAEALEEAYSAAVEAYSAE